MAKRSAKCSLEFKDAPASTALTAMIVTAHTKFQCSMPLAYNSKNHRTWVNATGCYGTQRCASICPSTSGVLENTFLAY